VTLAVRLSLSSRLSVFCWMFLLAAETSADVDFSFGFSFCSSFTFSQPHGFRLPLTFRGDLARRFAVAAQEVASLKIFWITWRLSIECPFEHVYRAKRTRLFFSLYVLSKSTFRGKLHCGQRFNGSKGIVTLRTLLVFMFTVALCLLAHE
jgi:hypothetical protein